MNHRIPRYLVAPALFGLAVSIPVVCGEAQRLFMVAPNEAGIAETLSSTGPFDRTGPFFQVFGSNGRSCATCHQPQDNWTVTPDHLRQRFETTSGTDPVFRTNDGSNCDTADVSSADARRHAYSLLLNKGLIRVEMQVPQNADFSVVSVSNPYGCGDTAKVSVYRRILPATNLRFLTTVMWDGRESLQGNSLEQNLEHQADDATTGHAQGPALASEQKREIVAFESGLTTAQKIGARAGLLDSGGARGGALELSRQPFSAGVNDPLGPGEFNPAVFTLFENWQDDGSAARQSIARGETIFNTKQFQIQGVAGLNDALNQPAIPATCTLCHNAPNVGNHSVPLAVNIGMADASRRTPDLPLFVLANKATGALAETTDPGRALVTGKWSDIGKFKGPVLRGLSGRAPYFHNGSAATLLDVVRFYDERFFIHFTDREKIDLVNFLGSL